MDEQFIALLENSNMTFEEKAKTNKEMSECFKQASAQTGVASEHIRKLKDFLYYAGRGWAGGNPLLKTKGEKYPDRFAPVFINLYNAITIIKEADMMDFAEPYIAALEAHGIKLDITNIDVDVNSQASVIQQAANTGCDYQSEICKLADSIKIDDAQTAENAGFSTKSEYTKVVKFYNDKSNDKDTKKQYKKHKMNFTAYDGIQKNANIGSPKI